MNCRLEFSSFLPEHESDIQFDMKLWGTSPNDGVKDGQQSIRDHTNSRPPFATNFNF